MDGEGGGRKGHGRKGRTKAGGRDSVGTCRREKARRGAHISTVLPRTAWTVLGRPEVSSPADRCHVLMVCSFRLRCPGSPWNPCVGSAKGYAGAGGVVDGWMGEWVEWYAVDMLAPAMYGRVGWR